GASPVWLPQAWDESVGKRVHRPDEHDRDGRGRLLCSDSGWSCRRNNEIDLEPDELGRDLSETLGASLSPAILNGDGSILDPTEFAQPLPDCCAPAASGHAAAPPSSVMNSRRFIRSPRRRVRVAYLAR